MSLMTISNSVSEQFTFHSQEAATTLSRNTFRWRANDSAFNQNGVRRR